MNLTTTFLTLGRKAKRALTGSHAAPVYPCPVRRIERVALGQRVCAMTFDDGPCLLPPSADPGGKPLTLQLMETLEAHGARGTFDVVGDTAGNYPDKPGREGTAAWGGLRYDHYPDIGRDDQGGAAHAPELIARMLEMGHAVTNHTYAHVLFGRKNVVYGQRAVRAGLEDTVADLRRLHDLLERDFGYTMTLARPPHYVDRMADGFSSYDAYAMLGYQYMAASYDGAGWMPLDSYRQEVDAMVKPMETLLTSNPDALCGQIIFQKDGFNMARRTPVADGLGAQLDLLARYGYRVVTVPELLTMSPCADVKPGEAGFDAARRLLDRGLCAAYRDNTLRLDQPANAADAAALLFGREGVLNRAAEGRPIAKGEHPCAGAFEALRAAGGPALTPDAALTGPVLDELCRVRFDAAPGLTGSLSRRDLLLAVDGLCS